MPGSPHTTDHDHPEATFTGQPPPYSRLTLKNMRSPLIVPHFADLHVTHSTQCSLNAATRGPCRYPCVASAVLVLLSSCFLSTRAATILGNEFGAE